jgi:hypothetical protein
METQSTLKPVGSTVFVTLPEALQSKIKMESGVELYIDPSFEPEQWAVTKGIVHSVGDRYPFDIRPGEDVMISYMLVADYWNVDGERKFNRVKRYNDEIVWEADDWMIMAVLRDGEWQGIGQWVVLDDAKVEEMQSSLIIIPEAYQAKVRPGCGVFVSGDLPIPKGNIAYFNEQFRSYYNFPNGKKRMVMKKELILAHGTE